MTEASLTAYFADLGLVVCPPIIVCCLTSSLDKLLAQFSEKPSEVVFQLSYLVQDQTFLVEGIFLINLTKNDSVDCSGEALSKKHIVQIA